MGSLDEKPAAPRDEECLLASLLIPNPSEVPIKAVSIMNVPLSQARLGPHGSDEGGLGGSTSIHTIKVRDDGAGEADDSCLAGIDFLVGPQPRPDRSSC